MRCFIILIGIDPGKNGALAALRSGEIVGEDPLGGRLVCTWNFKDLTEQDIWKLFEPFSKCSCRALIEKVHSFPAQGVRSMFSFGQIYGSLRMALIAARIPFEEVSPMKWQKTLECQSKGDKNITKAKAQQIYPDLKVTHANADALLIATYLLRKVSGEITA